MHGKASRKASSHSTELPNLCAVGPTLLRQMDTESLTRAQIWVRAVHMAQTSHSHELTRRDRKNTPVPNPTKESKPGGSSDLNSNAL